nr:uncharacterized protein LOC110438038 isoform X1 [Danio rerio]|eukprot:XP_021323064.1 uncharacterized protein LOC110438038 isoform X1 [Danio rerio]
MSEQSGGAVTQETSASATVNTQLTDDGFDDDDDDDSHSTSHATHGRTDIESTHQSNVDDEQPSTSNVAEPLRHRPTRQIDIETLLRDGGNVNEYHVLPRPRFNSVSLRRTLNMSEIRSQDLASYHIRLHDTMDDIVSFARQIGGDGSVINLCLRTPTLKSDVNAVLTPGNNYDVNLFTDQIAKILQSDDRLSANETVEIEAEVVMNRLGGGRRKLTDLAFDQVIKRKKTSLFIPTNISNKLCFSICIAHFLDPKLPECELENHASIIHNKVGLAIQDKVGFHDIAKFENMLDIKIVVFYRTNTGVLQTYVNNTEPHDKTVYLYLQDEHYYMILNLKSFIGANFVCEFCYKGYTSLRNHQCKHVCNVCFDSECYKHPKKIIHCTDCLRYCKSSYCYQAHKKPMLEGEKVPCNVIKYCKKCNRRYDKKMSKHICAPNRCGACREELVPGGEHECFIKTVALKDPQNKYIFYDFETRYENGRHVANFVCAITFCGERFVAGGSDCVKKMIDHFRKPKYEGYCFIAHNASGFDSFLILEYFCKAGLQMDIIMKGCKLIFMFDVSFKQRYIDSISFIPMALSKMPAALNLTTTEKGYFPHHFNRLENENYVGPYPDKKYYGYENLSEKDQAKFDAWYATTSGEVFDFKEQLCQYGVNDVVLLREACMTYRESFIECTQIDPFSYTTLPSCCMGIFKTHYLKDHTIALTHENAYIRQNKTFSSVSIEWLEYLKKTRNVDIHHALNHGEMQIGQYFLDGYYEQDDSRYGLDFLGCLFHAHQCRYEPHKLHPMSGVPFGVLRRQVDEKIEILQNAYGLKVEIIWECEWSKMKQTDPSVIEFMSTYSAPERLKPRDALFGGRTNAYKLYHKVGEGETISYLDVTSLYPFVMSTKTYPIGHPEIIFNDFQPIENYYGLIKATVYPPRKLLHPVLPYRCGGKLMFPLCRTCAHDENQTSRCNHTDDERALSGSWVSVELLKAIEKGYVVVKVDEVWHFPERSDKLFSEYVKTFLRLKQQASGYPSNVTTDSEKETYIRKYYEREGIQLDPSQITHNPAQRAINKLILNAVWGRFAMQSQHSVTQLVRDPEEFTTIVFGKTDALKYFTFISDDVALVQFQPTEDSHRIIRDINVFIGAYTTSWARLELYKLMDKLGDRLLYSDTDSVIFVSKAGDWMPPLGDYLGDLTDEIGDGDYITEFCSSGPKSYGYRTASGKVCMKAKGITLNAKNSQTIRLDTLIGLVDGYVTSGDDSRYILAQADNIVRNKKHLTLHNKSVVKKFKVVYNKRRLLPDYTTLPYGF